MFSLFYHWLNIFKIIKKIIFTTKIIFRGKYAESSYLLSLYLPSESNNFLGVDMKKVGNFFPHTYPQKVITFRG